ncbi:TRAP transporter substrate-binding protein [Marinobacterium rhizophilum]|uniref:TRAP transporter substrate-binding protein n=1 Tax=Marinobacterium rhizophilum TaxID=420402 RepID=A0ABY5HG81_9GAMM|nr:TRAP transporter substrate-binding protein [Marinobacterium rhizophilum]UTW11290.1 TRAP transporter substrate-binding protein [Marinobacterium rhizophilum]
MKRRDLIKGAGAGLLAAGTGIAAPAIAKGVKQWRMQMTWRANSPLLATGPQLVADYINKASNGRLELKLYAAGDLVSPFQVLDAVADGTLHMGHGYPAYWAGKLAAVQFFAPIPFGFTSQEQNAWFHYGGGQELADEVYGELGVKFLPSGNTSVQAAGWYNKELNSIESFKGLKIRSGGLGAKVLTEIGGVPVQMPLGEVPQGLQSGAIDGADFVGPFNDMAFGLHKVAKHYYWPGWMEPSAVLDCFINKEAWDSLDKDLQEIVKGANAMANQMVLSEFVTKNAQAVKIMKEEHKVDFRLLDPATLGHLGRVSQSVIDDVGQTDDLTRKVYASYRKFIDTVQPYSELSEMAFMNARAQLKS